LIDFCLRPIRPPAKAFIHTIIVIASSEVLYKIIYNRINSGAIFCHVRSSKQFVHLIISMVRGYQ